MTKPLQRNVLYICLDICIKLCYRHFVSICSLMHHEFYVFEVTLQHIHLIDYFHSWFLNWNLILHFKKIYCNKRVLAVFWAPVPALSSRGQSRTISRTRDRFSKASFAPPNDSSRHKQDICFYSINNLHYKQLLYDICSPPPLRTQFWALGYVFPFFFLTNTNCNFKPNKSQEENKTKT